MSERHQTAMTELTPRQAAILDFIESYTQEHGYPPSLREIGRHFGIKHTQGVMCHIRALEKKGAIQRDTKKSRAIRILR